MDYQSYNQFEYSNNFQPLQTNCLEKSLSEDDLCSSILAKFERMRLDDASTSESEDESKNREQLLKELVSQEIQMYEDYQMETQEQKDLKLNNIMQKLMMRYYLNLMLKTEKLNQRYMYNIMKSNNQMRNQ